MSKEQKREHERAKGGEDTIPWRALVFGLIGATAATIAASKLPSPSWMYSQLTRIEKFSKSEAGSKLLTEFREDACKLYERHKRELRLMADEDDMERLRNNLCLKADTWFPRLNSSYPLSHHYSILGLERSRAKPYTDDEIKKAFWAKIMECHPDRNKDNKEFAEAKFKVVMTAYTAIMARNDEKSTPI